MLTLSVSWALSHALPGRKARATSLMRFRWKNPVREERVSPAAAPPGIAQSVPALTPRSMSLAQVELPETAPHVSTTLMKGPLSVVTALPPRGVQLKIPAPFAAGAAPPLIVMSAKGIG